MPVAAAEIPVTSTATLTILHPLEGAKLPALPQVFVYGQAPVGSTLTINGTPIAVHSTGGYLTMVPLVPGDFVIAAEARALSGDVLNVERRVSVALPYAPLPASPAAIDKSTVLPGGDLWLSAGDTISVSFQGSPGGVAEFSIGEFRKHLPMVEVDSSTGGRRGFYQGHYVIQPEDKAREASIDVRLKSGRDVVRAKAAGRLTTLRDSSARIGLITEDTVAARTAPDGGYDTFLYKGMRVALTGRQGGYWRVRPASIQSGWVKESAVTELPPGTPPPGGLVTSISTAFMGSGAIVRLSVPEPLPYRVEQQTDPARLVLTLYGAAAKIDFVRYDPADPLIQRVRWRQTAPDVLEVTLETRLPAWWGFDVRYEPGALVMEIRKPWESRELKKMVIAIDAGHGGSESGATGNRGRYEKEATLAIARALAEALTEAGAKPVLLRDQDVDIPLYDRPRLAWRAGAQLFISLHGNSSGLWENPLWTNGSSVYWYQPQSQALAVAMHQAYRRYLPELPDRGLFWADFAVCRMTQMPAILIENAYLIVPNQEEKLFDPKYQKKFASTIVKGLKAFVAHR